MLSTIYALLCIIVPCSLYQLIFASVKTKNKKTKQFILYGIYFLLYIYLTFCCSIGSIWDIGHYDTIIRLEEINLLPFQSEG